MRNDFVAFILSNGRPDHVITVDWLQTRGYSGRYYIVIDDEDATGPMYRKRYGDRVLTFSKAEIAQRFDVGDQEPDRRTIVYARNACWDLARSVGAKYFIQLDDDYRELKFRAMGKKDEAVARIHGWGVRHIDPVLEMLVTFMETTPAASIAMAQGGDFIGGVASDMARLRLKRKAMNSFVCSIDRPFTFVGRINEDVNTYTEGGRRGLLFFTYSQLQLEQTPTQGNPGGMTDVYLESGTYLKSCFTVMYAPSCTTIVPMGRIDRRLHHRINWNAAAPKIVRESCRLTPKPVVIAKEKKRRGKPTPKDVPRETKPVIP
jgi:hypothetical protein